MSIFSAVKEAIRRMFPYKEAYAAFGVESPISSAMSEALIKWRQMYQKSPPWLSDRTKTMNLSALVCSRVAKRVTLEAKYNITGAGKAEDGTPASNPRSEFLSAEAEQKLFGVLRQKIEVAGAAGGVGIKPYPTEDRKHFCFSFCYDWDLLPVSFDGGGGLTDAIFPDCFQSGKTYYTRLERHTLRGANVHIENAAFKSTTPNALGTRCGLSEVPQWAGLEERAVIRNAGGMLFGWYRVAGANTVDLNCPLGAAIFDKACDVIKEADEQFYSGLLWEFKSGRRKVHVAPEALKFKKATTGLNGPVYEYDRNSALDTDLYVALDVQKGDNTDLYDVFSPPFREASYLNSLNQAKMLIEDLCELARGTISDANEVARTATELNIVRNESYSTIADNQKALAKALSDTIRAMDVYATLYDMAPAGEYEFSVDWGDAITDKDQELSRMLLLMNAGIMSKAEVREKFMSETKEQAAAAIQAIAAEKAEEAQAAAEAMTLPQLNGGI